MNLNVRALKHIKRAEIDRDMLMVTIEKKDGVEIIIRDKSGQLFNSYTDEQLIEYAQELVK